MPFKANSRDRKYILEMATKLVLTSQKNPPALTVTDYSLDKT